MQAVRWLLSVLLLVSTAGAAANDAALQSVDDIGAAAEAFVRERLPKTDGKGVSNFRVTAAKPDSRLRLTRCSVPLNAFQHGAVGLGPRTTIGVRCPTGAQWTIYLAVAVEAEMPLLVLRRAVARGATLVADDVVVRPTWVKGAGGGYLTQLEQLARMHAKRSLAVGTVLTPDMLMSDVLVKRGQEVTLVAQVGGVEVRAKGVALSDGAQAGRVRVQNLNSQRVVEGVVTADSMVRVAL